MCAHACMGWHDLAHGYYPLLLLLACEVGACPVAGAYGVSCKRPCPAQAWREHAYPLLRDHLARRVDSVISWGLLYHETAIANLLEVRASAVLHATAATAWVGKGASGAPPAAHALCTHARAPQVALFHRAAAESVGEDMLLELADWAYRKLAYLNTDGHAYAAAAAAGAGRSAAQLLHAPPEQELAERAGEVAWGAALCGLTIARYLAEHVGALPLGVMARLGSGNDTIMALLPLADRPPWVRTSKKGQVRGGARASGRAALPPALGASPHTGVVPKAPSPCRSHRRTQTERFADGRWSAVPPADRLKLGQLDAQVWLALHNLLLEPACRCGGLCAARALRWHHAVPCPGAPASTAGPRG